MQLGAFVKVQTTLSGQEGNADQRGRVQFRSLSRNLDNADGARMLRRHSLPAIVSATLSRLQWGLFSPRLTVLWGEILFTILGARVAFNRKSARILVVRLDDLGDMILCSGFLRELRRTFPRARISLLVKPRTFEIVQQCPYIDDVIVFDPSPGLTRFGPLFLYVRALRLAVSQFWPRRFDMAVNPRRDADYFQANFLAYISGAGSRTGFVAAETMPSFINDRILDTAGAHEVTQNMAVIPRLGGVIGDDSLELWMAENDRATANDLLISQGVLPGEPLFAIAPGAANPYRVWPIERYKAVAEQVYHILRVRTVVVGGANDVAAGAFIAPPGCPHAMNLAGRTNVRQTAAVLGRCRAFLGNDSGPMHLAAAARVPVVEVCSYPTCGKSTHANSPARFGPWKVPSIVLQPSRPLAPCSDNGCQARTAHCITQVGTDQVVASVLNLLSGQLD